MSSPLLQTPDTSVNGVQVWTAHLDAVSSAELEELSAVLDAAEHARAARFHFEHDRRHYLASRALLRQLLGAALDKPAPTLIFEYGAQGKPALAAAFSQDRILRFNLSHSAGWAMFALAWDRELGIDLESGGRLKRDGDGLSALAGRVLSARELSIWQALPDAAARDAAFLRAWTRKEAYAKATGKGLFVEVNRIEVALDAAAPNALLTLPSLPQEGEAARHWTLHDLAAPDGFTAALAVERKGE
ncbi:MAG TPA: 4'-phosphopantetheinyl transferase superfamily protein [Chthoniobacterales bacterium]|nr:4'-phosphopantetheinyl transferase superfamily protein [Chthoniobacterales bacterium]